MKKIYYIVLIISFSTLSYGEYSSFSHEQYCYLFNNTTSHHLGYSIKRSGRSTNYCDLINQENNCIDYKISSNNKDDIAVFISILATSDYDEYNLKVYKKKVNNSYIATFSCNDLCKKLCDDPYIRSIDYCIKD